jgi:hypothetical protein
MFEPFEKKNNKEFSIFNISINKQVGNGNITLFWQDRWLSECSLRTQYSLLYDLALYKEIKVSEAIEYNRFYLSITRTLDITLVLNFIHYINL